MTWASSTYTASYNYNTLGKLNELIYPLAPGQANPFAVLYNYSKGYVSSLQNYTGGVVGTTFWQLTSGAPNMDSWGHVIDETLGTTSAVRIQSAYDGVTSWVNTRTVGSGGSLNNLQNLAYQWDLNGNLSQRQDQIQSLTEALNYDNLNRIQTSTLNGTQNLSMAIDNTGNITSRTEGGATYPYTYDTTHKHAIATLGGTLHTYTYDANGNMATRDGSSLTWASYNLPTMINDPSGVSSTFYYGPDRQRKEQVARYISEGQNGTETTIYVFGLYEYELTPAQTHNKYFIQVPGGTQIVYDIQSVSGTQTTYVTADHLGSGNLFLNSAGTVQIKESYRAYGRRRTADWSQALPATSSDYTTIASTTRRGYTDALHEFLDNVSLIHMNGRVYDPVSGRFLSPDPVVTQIGDSQRGNPYSYVENRPLTLTDPSGFGCPAGTQCWDEPLDPNYSWDLQFGFGPQLSFSSGQNALSINNSTTIQATINVFAGSNQNTNTFVGNFYQMPGGNWGYQGADNPFFSSSNLTFNVGHGSSGGSGDGPSGPPGEGSPAEQEPKHEPQGNQPTPPPPTQCPGGISGNFTAQQGIFGNFDTKIRGLSAQIGVNLISYNTPLNGQPYLSHGFNLSIGAGAVRVGFSYQATSTNGGLSFQPSDTNFNFWDVSASQSGLDYDLSLGVFSGFSINVKATPAGTCPVPGK
jgi:RHS repeat-associated protein